MDFDEVIAKRRSARDFTAEPISKDVLMDVVQQAAHAVVGKLATVEGIHRNRRDAGCHQASARGTVQQ